MCRTWVAVVLTGTLLTSGCGSGPSDSADSGSMPGNSVPGAVEQALQNGTAVAPQVVAADNAFGLMLLDDLNPGATSNVAISPTSIALALQMVYNGAEDSVQQGMSQALQLQGLGALAVDQDNAALQASLINPDPQVQLTIANSLWMHLNDNPVLPAFINTNQTYYAAEIGDLSGAPEDVNAWVASETNGLITQILPAADYTHMVAVLANAIYFKGAWTSAFNPDLTASAPFTLTDGTQVSCRMMSQAGSFPYLQGSNFQALELPYGQAGRLGMLLILPAVGVDLSSFVAGMTGDQVNSWLAALEPANVSVGLPRFTATYGASLVNALTSLGMGMAFDSNMGELPGLAPDVYISDVEHKVVVQVDESGTVATGVTTVTISPTLVVADPVVMTLNRPFFYAIVDQQTGALLFIGTLVDPTQGST
jgi:serpin B